MKYQYLFQRVWFSFDPLIYLWQGIKVEAKQTKTNENYDKMKETISAIVKPIEPVSTSYNEFEVSKILE